MQVSTTTVLLRISSQPSALAEQEEAVPQHPQQAAQLALTRTQWRKR
jgi:hypothetical protein